MENAQGPKTPLQIRLDHAELAALDAYIARFTDFPPSRVDVMHKALMEWLAQKLEPALQVQARQPPPSAPNAVPAPATSCPMPQGQQSHRQRILEVLPALPTRFKTQQVAARTSLPPKAVWKVLQRMVKEQEVRQVKPGLYAKVRRCPPSVCTEGSLADAQG